MGETYIVKIKAIFLGFLIGVAGLVISPLDFSLNIEEDKGLGLLFKLRGARQAPSDVVVVSIDKASSDYFKSPEYLKSPESLNVPDNPCKPLADLAHTTGKLAYRLLVIEAR